MKRVLVVDDDVAVQRHCREILEAEGFEVHCEASLGSTRRSLRTRRPDVVVLDLFLPDGCGFELFRTSAELIDGVPVIGMTAVYQGGANARLLTARYPFRGMLVKPVSPGPLLGALRTVLAGGSWRPADSALPALAPAAPDEDAELARVDAEDELEVLDSIFTPRVARPHSAPPPPAPATPPSTPQPARLASSRPSPSMNLFVSPLDALAAERDAASAVDDWDPTGLGEPAAAVVEPAPPPAAEPPMPPRPRARAPEPRPAEARTVEAPSSHRSAPVLTAVAPATIPPPAPRVEPTPDPSVMMAAVARALEGEREEEDRTGRGDAWRPRGRSGVVERRSSWLAPAAEEPAPEPAAPVNGVGAHAPERSTGSSSGSTVGAWRQRVVDRGRRNTPERPVAEVRAPVAAPSPALPPPVDDPWSAVDYIGGASDDSEEIHTHVVDTRASSADEYLEPEVIAVASSFEPFDPDRLGLAVPRHMDPRYASLQGRLDATPFPSILARLARERTTGSLMLRRDQVKKIVYIEHGVPIAVKSNLLYECLGKLMVRDGLISEDACELSVERLKVEGRRQGEILIELGALHPDQLGPALEAQFDTKLYDVFTWEAGLFQFRPAEVVEAGLSRVLREPLATLLYGVRLQFPVERISMELIPYSTWLPVLLVPGEALYAMYLSDAEWEILSLLDGRRSFGEIVSLTGNSDMTWRLVYGLVAVGWLAFAERERPHEPLV